MVYFQMWFLALIAVLAIWTLLESSNRVYEAYMHDWKPEKVTGEEYHYRYRAKLYEHPKYTFVFFLTTPQSGQEWYLTKYREAMQSQDPNLPDTGVTETYKYIFANHVLDLNETAPVARRRNTGGAIERPSAGIIYPSCHLNTTGYDMNAATPFNYSTRYFDDPYPMMMVQFDMPDGAYDSQTKMQEKMA